MVADVCLRIVSCIGLGGDFMAVDSITKDLSNGKIPLERAGR